MSWLTLLGVTLAAASLAWAGQSEPLALETKIMLRDVKGRIDHFAADPLHQRLFVAELGNNTVGVVDLKAGKVVRRIGGLREPQDVPQPTRSMWPMPETAPCGFSRATILSIPAKLLLAMTPTTSGAIPKRIKFLMGLWRCSIPLARSSPIFRSKGILKVFNSSAQRDEFSSTCRKRGDRGCGA